MEEKPTVGGGLKQLERVAGRAGADTIKLWDSYREQAYFWRALSLVQIPATVLAVVAAMLVFTTRDQTVQCPTRPLPGYYSASQLPDSAFIQVATELVNLLATYNYETVAAQYSLVRTFLWEPALSEFQNFMKREIPRIRATKRSQAFHAPRQLVRVLREEHQVRVFLRGELRFWIGDVSPPKVKEQTYEIHMKTVGRNLANNNGITVVGVLLHTPN